MMMMMVDMMTTWHTLYTSIDSECDIMNKTSELHFCISIYVLCSNIKDPICHLLEE